MNLKRKETAKAMFIEKLKKLGYVKALPKKGFEQSSVIMANCSCYFSSTEMYFSPSEFSKIGYAVTRV